MTSKRSHEGYFECNHKYSPGIPEAVAQAAGYPQGAGKKDTVFECATYTCADCERVVYINPKRTRPRGYCPKCDHYLCDDCEAIRFASGGECRNFKLRVDKMLQRGVERITIEDFSSPLCSTTVDVPLIILP